MTSFESILEILRVKSKNWYAAEPCSCGFCDGKSEHIGFGPVNIDLLLGARVSIASLLFVLGELLSLPEWARVLFLVTSALLAGYDIILNAVKLAMNKVVFNEYLVISIASIAAFAVGRDFEGTAVILLYQFGVCIYSVAVKWTNQYLFNQLVNSAASDDKAAGILQSLLSHSEKKSKLEMLIRKIAKYFIPGFIAVAVLTAILLPVLTDLSIKQGVYRGAMILVIASPAALLISVPLSFFAGIAKALNLDIIVKDMQSMEALSNTKIVVFDKSGTLTHGNYRVASVRSERFGAKMLLKIAAHAEAYSTHPIAKAVTEAYAKKINIDLIDSFMEYPSEGVGVRVSDMEILLGSAEFLLRNGVNIWNEIDKTEIAIFMSVEGKYAGKIILGERLREDSISAVKDVESVGGSIAMITDDGGELSARFAEMLGITEYYSDCLPADKVIRVHEMKRRADRKSLVFVSEGRNSEDALSEADVGVLLSTKNINEADVLIIDEKPAKVASAIFLAKQTQRIAIYCIAICAVVKVALLVCGLLGLIPLWLTYFIDFTMTFIAILNAMRAYSIIPPNLRNN